MSRGVNFRSTYLRAVGVDGLEIKEILRREFIGIERLKQLVLNFGVTSVDRVLVWRHLLRICPAVRDAAAFVQSQQAEQYLDLLHAAKLIWPCVDPEDEGLELGKTEGDWGLGLDEDDPKLAVIIKTFVTMHMLRDPLSRRRAEPILGPVEPACSEREFVLCRAVREVAAPYGHETWFSLYSGLTSRLTQLQGGEWVCFERVLALVQLEHSDLHSHLSTLDTSKRDAVTQAWFVDWFTLTLPASVLVRMYDRLLAGSAPLACFAGVALALVLKKELLDAVEPSQLVQLLVRPKPITVMQRCDTIVSNMVSLWTKHNCPHES